MTEILDWLGIVSWVVMPIIILCVDMLPPVVAARTKVCEITDETAEVDDFAVLVPIYGNVKYLENVEYLSQYGSKVMLCTTTEEDDEFNEAIAEIAEDNGFQLFMTDVPGRKQKPGARRAVAAPIRDKVIADALAIVEATYVVCIDADTETEQSLALLVGGLADSGMDVASVRLLPSNGTTNMLTRLQAHEYHMSMRMRRLYPWLVSGACHVAKTAVHHEVMKNHTLFFQGNDVEFGILADAMGYDVGHIPFDVPTTVPHEWYPWLRQRYAWAGGEFRVYFANLRFARRQPIFYFYGAVLVYLLTPFRWWAILRPNWVVALAIVAYVVILMIFHRKRIDVFLLAVPFYAMIGTLLLAPLAAWSYVSMAVKHSNWGLMKPGRERLNARTAEGYHWSGVPTYVSSVRQLQMDLAAVGFDPGRKDGEFGYRTHAALQGWQRQLIDQGYDLGPDGVDGIFGALTAAASSDAVRWIGIEDDSVPTSSWLDGYQHADETYFAPT